MLLDLERPFRLGAAAAAGAVASSAMHDPELVAAGVYAEAGFEFALPPGPRALAIALPWITGVEVVDPTEVMGEGQLERDGAGWRVLVSSAIESNRLRVDFVLAHELAEGFAVKHSLYLGPFLQRERFCDAVAGALIAPRPAFLRAIASGRKYNRLARLFDTTGTLIALRVWEIERRPIVVFGGPKVRVCGPWPSPSDAESLKRIALKPPAWARATRLRDDPARVVLEVAAA